MILVSAAVERNIKNAVRNGKVSRVPGAFKIKDLYNEQPPPHFTNAARTY